jgi:glutathione S-transferase
MKLLFSGNSPYARRARIAVREADLMSQIEEVDLTHDEARLDVLLQYGPGGKVPVLVTESGVALCESMLICKYLDELAGGKLYPSDAAKRLQCLQLESMASVLLDSLFTRSRENRRPAQDQSASVIAFEAQRAARCYDALDASIAEIGIHADNGAFTVVVALGYANFRHPDDDWRGGRTTLSTLYDELMVRPALIDTAPVF